jgi:hypothetical protein
VQLLNDQLAGDDSPAMRRALQAAGLALLDPHRQIDARLIQPLDDPQRAALLRYQTLLAEVAERLELGKPVDPAALAARLEATSGQKPLTIRTAQLCRSVGGFGVYEPFATHRFPAGRSDTRVIVYVELENYTVKPDGEFNDVRLEQELVLYTDADGLAVWRHPPQKVVDRARRVRRDFFVVQLIQLPSNLGVGKYALKVRLTDQHSGAVDEITLPIELVADASMVAPGEPATVAPPRPRREQTPLGQGAFSLPVPQPTATPRPDWPTLPDLPRPTIDQAE